MKKMYTRAEALVAGAAVLGLAACGSSASSDTASSTSSSSGSSADAADTAEATDGDLGLVTEGKLTVAMSPDYPPFENIEGEEWVGVDVDLATALAEQMGLEVEFKNIQFDGITAAIEAGGQADVGISAMTVTPEREDQVDFSDSYYIDDLSVVTMQSNADVTADNYEDVLNAEDVVIAVQSGTTAESYTQENFASATTQPYGNATDCFAAMQAGQANAVITNKAVAASMVADAYTDAQVIKDIATGEEYACAVSKDNPALLDAVNEAIAALTDDGTIDEINTKYFG